MHMVSLARKQPLSENCRRISDGCTLCLWFLWQGSRPFTEGNVTVSVMVSAINAYRFSGKETGVVSQRTVAISVVVSAMYMVSVASKRGCQSENCMSPYL